MAPKAAAAIDVGAMDLQKLCPMVKDVNRRSKLDHFIYIEGACATFVDLID